MIELFTKGSWRFRFQMAFFIASIAFCFVVIAMAFWTGLRNMPWPPIVIACLVTLGLPLQSAECKRTFNRDYRKRMGWE